MTWYRIGGILNSEEYLMRILNPKKLILKDKRTGKIYFYNETTEEISFDDNLFEVVELVKNNPTLFNYD